MRIAGLQKLTLLDFPGKVACTVFTAGCNFRCPFCQNASLVLPERFGAETEPEEILKFLRRRQGVLDGVAVTGGEPMMHPDLPDFMRSVRELGFRLKLDTNGSFPDRLAAVIDEGLVDYVAMDVKNAPELYAATAGVSGLDVGAIDRSRALLMEGRVPYEFRTTVVKGLHTAESLLRAAQWIEGASAWYLQQYRDSGEILSASGLGAFGDEEMQAFAAAVCAYVPTSVRGI